MPHVSIRDRVTGFEGLYGELQGLYGTLELRLGLSSLGVLGALVWTLVTTGGLSNAGLCITVLAGMNWVWQLSDLIALNWFMHQMTLQDLIQVKDPDVGVIASALCEIADGTSTPAD